MTLLERVRTCAQYRALDFRPFVVAGLSIGQIRADAIVELTDFGDVFDFTDQEIQLKSNVRGFAERTRVMGKVARTLRDRGLIAGWRDEMYPAAPKFGDPAVFDIERAAVPFFGIRGYGVHINGWVKTEDGPMMWIGRRSLTKPTGPGLLDQVVAGGLPSGMALMENVIKECEEEASIHADLARQAVSVGTVSYITEREEGLRHDVLFNYDLLLPTNFSPVNEDGEVAEFMLWPMAQVHEEVGHEGVFKFNAALVVIDFLVRHGFVDPESPGYTDVVSGLHL